jgi:hypothetical protein
MRLEVPASGVSSAIRAIGFRSISGALCEYAPNERGGFGDKAAIHFRPQLVRAMAVE